MLIAVTYRYLKLSGIVAAYFVQSCYACGLCTVQSETLHSAQHVGVTIIILNDFNILTIL